MPGSLLLYFFHKRAPRRTGIYLETAPRIVAGDDAAAQGDFAFSLGAFQLAIKSGPAIANGRYPGRIAHGAYLWHIGEFKALL